jgi:hypothetical protein
MTTLKPSYGSATAITCTTTSLTSDTNLLAGRQSNVVNNTSDLGVDVIIGGTIATTSTPTANTVIEFWLFGSWDNGTTYSAAAGGGDGNFSPATIGSKNLMSLAAVISQTDTTARTYTLGPISVGQMFGGVMPDHWGFYVVHNTAQTLGATTMKYTPIQYVNV